MPRPGLSLCSVALLTWLFLVTEATSSNRSTMAKDSSVGNSLGPLCRSRDFVLPPAAFERHACALCYRYTHESDIVPNAKWSVSLDLWEDDLPSSSAAGEYGGGKRRKYKIWQLKQDNITVVVNSSDTWSPFWESFYSNYSREKWSQCCEKAVRCCQRMVANNKSIEEGWCPRTWDGWGCWEDQPPNSKQTASCPPYIRIGTQPPSCDMFATKTCLDSGQWYKLANGTGEEWSNYTSCSVVGSMRRRVLVSVSSYGLTIAALLPALVVFFSYRQLQVPRIILHKNLFVSLLANAVCVILFRCIVILSEFEGHDGSVISQNGSGCKLLLILTKYFRLTNYMWMFCEGFYLHRLIAAAFAEQKSLLIFYMIGWGFPAIPTTLYAVLRATLADERCWALPAGAFEWCISLPSVLSLLLNTVFLINIIRVLVTKLRAAHANEPSQYRKTVRATLVLLPLFGLHFVVTVYRPKGGGGGASCEWVELYFYVDYLLDGLQGFLVALIFCYFNGEVHYLIKRSYFRFVESRNPSRRSGGSRSWLTIGNRNGSSATGWDTTRTRASVVHSTMVSSTLVEAGNGAGGGLVGSTECRRDSNPCRLSLGSLKGDATKNGDTIL